MKTILIAGAGKSSIYLIEYLLAHAGLEDWRIIVADSNRQAAQEKVGASPFAEVVALDITNSQMRQALVNKADLVVSLMPPTLHTYLAKDCLQFRKNLITSSYASADILAMDVEAREKGLTFMCEMGLDPGIDHMTASSIFHRIHASGGTVTSFKSYCGGLVAPESDDNPWHYKFSWNPKNVVVAGADGARFLENGEIIEVPYDALFDETKLVEIVGFGPLAYYPNRDSMRYISLYQTPEIKTLMRATLRYPAFSLGWKAVVALGMTDQNDEIHGVKSYKELLARKCSVSHADLNIEQTVANKLHVSSTDPVLSMLSWLGLFEEQLLPEQATCSADALLHLLIDKWGLQPHDKDLVIMQHNVTYRTNKEMEKNIVSTMIHVGESESHSAMAKTVGLPMAILAHFQLKGIINAPKGVCIPTLPQVYKPILEALASHQIIFNETEY